MALFPGELPDCLRRFTADLLLRRVDENHHEPDAEEHFLRTLH
jgi:hypothetical protein